MSGPGSIIGERSVPVAVPARQTDSVASQRASQGGKVGVTGLRQRRELLARKMSPGPSSPGQKGKRRPGRGIGFFDGPAILKRVFFWGSGLKLMGSPVRPREARRQPDKQRAREQRRCARASKPGALLPRMGPWASHAICIAEQECTLLGLPARPLLADRVADRQERRGKQTQTWLWRHRCSALLIRSL